MSNTTNDTPRSDAPRGWRAGALSAGRKLHEWLTALVSAVLFAGEPMAVVWDDTPSRGDDVPVLAAKHRTD